MIKYQLKRMFGIRKKTVHIKSKLNNITKTVEISESIRLRKRIFREVTIKLTPIKKNEFPTSLILLRKNLDVINIKIED